jgi:pyruvate dehydrogenase E1 component
MRCRGFLVGATSGRTTLAGEGLQHQDGHSHVLAYPHPNILTYDPAFAYELAVILKDGIRRMCVDCQDVLYYLTVLNEPYPMPPKPSGCEEGILRGMYRFRSSGGSKRKLRVQLLGSGAILNEILKAQEILEEKYGVSADVWSVTSYKQLFHDALAAERRNRLLPRQERSVPYVTQCLGEEPGVVLAASDYIKALPYSIARWIPGTFVALGTDGFGRSDGRSVLRDFFEVDALHITVTTLSTLAREGKIEPATVLAAIEEMGINPDRDDPATA